MDLKRKMNERAVQEVLPVRSIDSNLRPFQTGREETRETSFDLSQYAVKR